MRTQASDAGCTYREVLVNEGTRQKVEVEHAAGWRFLMFHGSFHTRLIVEQAGAHRPCQCTAVCAAFSEIVVTES